MSLTHHLTAILPCNDLDASEAFYNRLGFTRPDADRPAPGDDDTYRMLADGKGGTLHLNDLPLYRRRRRARRRIPRPDRRAQRPREQTLGHVRIQLVRP